jgi:hypothetical protein
MAIGVAMGASFRSAEEPCPQCAEVHRHHRTKTEEPKSQKLIAKS